MEQNSPDYYIQVHALLRAIQKATADDESTMMKLSLDLFCSVLLNLIERCEWRSVQAIMGPRVEIIHDALAAPTEQDGLEVLKRMGQVQTVSAPN